MARPEPRGTSPHVRGARSPICPATGPTGGAKWCQNQHGVDPLRRLFGASFQSLSLGRRRPDRDQVSALRRPELSEATEP